MTMIINAPAPAKVKAVIPFEDFEKIYGSLKASAPCSRVWCRFSRTTCHVRETREAIRGWWNKTNGETTPGFSNYERVLQNAINVENKFYWMFWTDRMADCRDCYEELAQQVRSSFQGGSIDTKKTWKN